MFRYATFIAFGCLMVFVSHGTSAQSFEELETTLRDHPSLQSLGYEASANRERAHAAGVLPDPVFSAGINNFPIFDPAFDAFLPTNRAIGVEQNFGSRHERKARAAEQRARADEIMDRLPQRYAHLRAELIALLHDKARVARQRELAGQRDKKYAELLDVAESEIDAGRPSLFRLAEIERERIGVARTLIQLDGDAAQLDARLIDLVGQVPSTAPPRVKPVPWNGDSQAFYAMRVANAAVTAREKSVDAARASLNPRWGAQLTYQQRDSGPDFEGDDWVSMSLSVTVPVWARRAKTPRVRAATAQRVAAQANSRAAQRAAIAQYKSLEAMRETAAASITLLERKIATIEDQVASELTVYESGAGDYSRVLHNEIEILELRASIAAQNALLAASTARMNALLVNQ